jgi:hypothetical protein
MKWPVFDMDCLKSYFATPRSNTISNIFHTLYEKVEPFLYRDLFSRLPGRFARIDGTFKIMKKTMNMNDAEELNSVQVKILGEYNHVVSFAQCGAEENLVFERLFHLLHKRMLRIGGEVEAKKLIAVYSDTCCQNKTNPNDHFITKIFPNCKRAPLKDVFHAIELVLYETTGFGHPLHNAFRDGLWGAILKWETESEDAAVLHFMKHHDEGKTIKAKTLALSLMRKYDRYKYAI